MSSRVMEERLTASMRLSVVAVCPASLRPHETKSASAAAVIRKYCRETPKLAITRQTVSELKYQLIYTSKSIEQIAKELHFPDTSYMCRYFRRKTGRALDEYRKEMK
ncbi:MAG: helix-turn-helix domain-containing protein [Prevotella sp.]|nr:helix-turn-helix domain-containing protein [Prevotella sp.]